MKRPFLLTFLLVLSFSLHCWAEFNPITGKMYALKEKTSGLYLDIQTLGINEANANATTNNISLNVVPCAIYFEASNGKWKMKNINDTYVQQASSRNWNVVIGSSAYEWTIKEPSTGTYTISRADGKYINVDTKAVAQPLFCDKETGMEFSLVEYTSSNLSQGYYTLKSSTGTFFSFTKTGDTKASFQNLPTYFNIIPSVGILMFEDKNNPNNYIGSTHSWNTTTDCSLWSISEPDESGSVKISRHKDNLKNIGSDQNSNVGTGIYTNVGEGCNRWILEGVFDYPTNGSIEGGKYKFNSGVICYYNPCNKLRFTLTESAAFYVGGKKRFSLDSFVLYDVNGKAVELKDEYFSGNNSPKNYASMLDGVNGNYCAGDWNTGSEDDYFEIFLPAEVDLGGAFSFSFVTENTTMNAKAFRIETLYEAYPDYTFNVTAPNGETIIVKYNGEEVNPGATFSVASFDESLISATEIPGYTWSILIDDENETITLVYSEAPVVENPQAVVDLVNRIGGNGTSDKFKFVFDPSINSRRETFVLGCEDGRILIKGTSISAITTGLGWYLNYVAKINIAWNSLNETTAKGGAYTELLNLPLPAAETHVCDAKFRYYLNYCTFGYSMTSWTWKRWQQEIDWMALHGINMPLQIVGLEEVWRLFLTMKDGEGKLKYGYSDEAAKAFVAGPAFTAWWGMNNLEGWGGTASGSKSGYNNLAGAGGVQDDAWYARQKKLAKSIVDRQRELGMQPVLPGWSGMVPSNFASKSGYATRGNGGNWAGDFVRPLLLSVSNVNYAEIAADYYKCLNEVMGESQYYSMDPFHEGGGAGTMEDYKALYAAMEAAKPNSKWVIQQWQWSATQKYSLTAVPAGRLIVLDLFSDGSPAFDSYNGYAPQDAVFCAIPNFGGRSGLMGRLQNVTDNYFKFKAKYASINGIGTAPEAIEQTPVTYDLIYQLPWMNGTKPNVQEWVANYAVARYGQDNEVIKDAWDLLRQGPLNYGADGIQGPVEDVWAARPNLDAKPASFWGKTLNNAGGTYTPARRQMLIDATYKLLSQKETLNLVKGSMYESNYNYDLVEFGGGVMADYAYDLLKAIKTAKDSEGTSGSNYIARRDAFLALIADVDKFKGTNLNFRLGKWTQEARDAAGEVEDAKTATADWYEYNNARTILTTWSSPGTNLNDYSYRSWQGLMKDVYLPRWQYYFENNRFSASENECKFFEWNWAHGMEHYMGQTSISSTPLIEGAVGHTNSYTREPIGNTVKEAEKLLGKYIIPILKHDGGMYYAYRHLNNELVSNVTIEVMAGKNDLTRYLGNLSVSSLSSDVITSATDLKNVVISEEKGNASYPATLILQDKTVIKFTMKKVEATVERVADAVQYFLDTTPETAGFPKNEARQTLQNVINAGESIDAINQAQREFMSTSNVNMPEDGKAYVIRNVHQNGNTYMLTNGYNGNAPVLPVATVNPAEDDANIFICRTIDGGYIFVNASHGQYMLFHGKDDNKPLSDNGFSETYSENNILKLYSQASKRFGTLSIAGKRDKGTTYGTMTISPNGNMDANGGENNAIYSNSWSSLFTFEQVDNVMYSVNTPPQTPISSEDVLLQGILENQTISTFSAPYATIIPQGITVYYAKNAIIGETIYLSALDAKKALPANEGVILVGEVGMKTTTILPATTEDVAVIDNVFANSAAAPVEMGDNDYILAKGNDGIGIYKAEKGLLLAAGKAFLRFETSASAPKLILSIEKGPTSVRETLVKNPIQQAIYDLGGRRVGEISKDGFYIVNGKKMIFK